MFGVKNKMFEHYDLMMWVFMLCIIIAVIAGSNLALKIYDRFLE